MDEARYAAAKALLDAAHQFWKACHKEGQYGAVQWLTGTQGELIIFTRGEYKDLLMQNIHMLPSQVGKVHFFNEEMSPDTESGDEPQQES